MVLYRGMTYNLLCVQSYTKENQSDSMKLPALEDGKSDIVHDKQVKVSIRTMESSTPISVKKVKGLSEGETMQLNDLNQLLDELGPRFTDWLGREPLPVDADLLPPVVPDYRTPFRILPYGVKRCVGNKGMTKLRRTARMIPPHFALGTKHLLHAIALTVPNHILLIILNILTCDREEPRIARSGQGYGEAVGKECHCKDSH